MAILFILGILFAGVLPLAIPAFIAAAILLILLAGILRRFSFAASSLIALAVLLSGIAAMQLDRNAFPQSSIANFTTDQPRLARLRLTITAPPRTTQGQWHQQGQIADAKVTDALCHDGWQPVTGSITLHLYNGDSLHLGDEIETLGYLARPFLADNPGEFNWLSYYRHQRILANFSITDEKCLRVIGHSHPNSIWLLRESARSLLLRGFSADQSTTAAVLDALVLGDRQSAERDIQDLFIQTGTPHLMVISGMHVFIVAAFIYLICHLLRLPPRRTAIIVLSCVILYGLIVLPSLPAARAVLFCSLILLGIIFRRSVDLLQMLAICALIILVFHPMDLTDAGFQLSFVTVFALIIFGSRISEWMLTWRATQPEIRHANPLWRHTRNSIISACIAWLAILPLILFYFNRLNPWAIFGGVSLLPFVFLGVGGGLLKIILTLLIPWLAGFWATLAAIPIYLLIHSVGWLAVLPASDILAPAPAIWIIVAYYALLFASLLPWRNHWKWARLSPVGGLFLLATPWGLTIIHPPTSLRVTILSVGAGSCAVAQSPDGHVAIFDAGSSTIANLERTVVQPFLRQEQIHGIDDIFISHPDADHYNAVASIMEDFPTHEILLDGAFASDARGSYGAMRLLDWFAQMQRLPRIVSPSDEIYLGRSVAIKILWPPAHSNWGHNDDSLVLQLRYAGRSILIPGDIEAIAERQLINLCPSLSSDILIAPHHGSSVNTTPFFIDAVHPTAIISSNDRTPTSKQRRFVTELQGNPLYATDKCGAVTAIIDAQGQISIEPFR